MLTEGDKNTCRELAREIIKEVLIQHIASCPHGRTLLSSKMVLIGICVGSSIGGGTLAAVILKVLSI